MKNQTVITLLTKLQQTFEARFDGLEKSNEKFEERFDRLEVSNDKIIHTVLSINERLSHVEDTMTTKQDLDAEHTTQDEILKIVRRVDDERVMTNLTLNRHDERITVLEKK